MNNKYLVETIVFDDIIPYLPFKNESSKENYKKAILKIDIEGFEPYAFGHAEQLFSVIDIRIIFMEWAWANLPDQNDEHNKVLAMRDFLYKRNYQALDDGKNLLDKNKWLTWPRDIIWQKQ